MPVTGFRSNTTKALTVPEVGGISGQGRSRLRADFGGESARDDLPPLPIEGFIASLA
jgi:hypothetical protein